MPLPITSICNSKLKFGDMLGIADKGTLFKSRLWPGGVLIYEISPELCKFNRFFNRNLFIYCRLDIQDPDEELIYKAMKHIETKTCIRFKKRVHETHYIEIFSGTG